MSFAERLAKAAEVAGAAAARVAQDLKPFAQGGLIDLQNAVVHAFPDSQQQATVLGMPGVPTPGEVDREQFDRRLEAAAQQQQQDQERQIER